MNERPPFGGEFRPEPPDRERKLTDFKVRETEKSKQPFPVIIESFTPTPTNPDSFGYVTEAPTLHSEDRRSRGISEDKQKRRYVLKGLRDTSGKVVSREETSRYFTQKPLPELLLTIDYEAKAADRVYGRDDNMYIAQIKPAETLSQPEGTAGPTRTEPSITDFSLDEVS